MALEPIDFSDITPGKPIRTYDETGKWRDWSTDEIVAQKLNFYRGWYCGAGVENLSINMDGDVFVATCQNHGKLGNIFEDFTIPDDWTVCYKPVCSCGADLFIPKAKTKRQTIFLRKHNGQPTHTTLRDNSQTDFVAAERTHSTNVKQVYWEVGRRCNYDCGYCLPWIHNNTDPHKSLEVLMSATKKLEEKFIKGSKVNFIISGGEPTANKHFLDWVRYLNSQGHHISLHSNGSRLPKYYKEIIHYGDLNLSVHFEFYDKEKFIKVVEAVVLEKMGTVERTGHLEVKVMMPAGCLDKALDLEESLKKIPGFVNYCTWAFVPIRGTMENKNFKRHQSKFVDEIMPDYTEHEIKFFGSRSS